MEAGVAEADDAGDLPVDLDRTRAVALQDLFRAHYLGLVRLAAQLVDDQATAEDVVQEVFASLNPGQQRAAEPLALLRVAVLNRSRSVLRRRRTARLYRPERLPHAPAADEASLQAAATTALLVHVRGLPHRQRELVVLRYYEGLSIPEIATLLHISPGAASSSLNRALTSLKHAVGRDNE
jgi:RNA polymerase sigma factor (sigma-70 family)